jgi:hypothetical protein
MVMSMDIVDRPDQPYVAVRRTITMQTFPEIADRLPGLFGWLAERGIAPAGPPFFRYLVIDMERELDVEAGVPVAHPSTATARCSRACCRPVATSPPHTSGTPTS